MGGLALGEVLEIVLILLLLGISAIAGLVWLGKFSRFPGKGVRMEFESRVLDELEVLRLRLDMMAKRLDQAGIERLSDSSPLPPGSEQGHSTDEIEDDAV